MAKLIIESYHLDSKPPWKQCIYCTDIEFKRQQDFVSHLRGKHCNVEGGSYVCLYGYNGVCSSLPVEGVDDKDYEEHVYKHHLSNITSRSHKTYIQKHHVPNIVTDGEQWTIFSASQNLPAVLNDPTKGKQPYFFTKMYGDGFVEKVDIKSSYLPDIQLKHFESYLKKIGKRYKKHQKFNNISSNSLMLQNLPKLKINKSLEKEFFDLSEIPKIFIQPTMDLSNQATFNQVFNISPKDPNSFKTEKLLQEKLSHYLDIIEVQIAHQVAYKSDAFFHAMTSHDALMEQMTETIQVVKTLREKIQHIDNSLVNDSLNILKLERSHCNHLKVYEKLKLMATVHQTQPMIQSLLSAPDYVAALDLISTTQEILVQELAGIYSFRHLGSQLQEMENLIDKMLSTEFERYATSDLNRPLNGDQTILEGDKLVSIIFGMLRQKNFEFIDKYKEEAFTTIKAIVKQMAIEVLSENDSSESELVLNGGTEQLQSLGFIVWINLLEKTTDILLKLILRVKAVHDIMLEAAQVTSGRMNGSSESDFIIARKSNDLNIPNVCDNDNTFLLTEEYHRIVSKLNDMMISVCNYCHEQIAQLMMPERSYIDLSNSAMNHETASQISHLSNLMDLFIENCEKISGKKSVALKSIFTGQASDFIMKFHQERKAKLNLILDNERWKKANVPTEFQHLIAQLISTGKFSLIKSDYESSKIDKNPADYLYIEEKKYAVVGTVLILLKMIAEYCICAKDLSFMSLNICLNLSELLQMFNSRCCQLVLGAGALQSAGLKRITTTNLALASSVLQLVIWLLPFIKNHFQDLLDKNQSFSIKTNAGINLLDNVFKDVNEHIQKIDNKVLEIITNLVTGQLNDWKVKPPVPSESFRNITRHLTKLHEAVSNILPENQVEGLYRSINKIFKDKIREQLMKYKVVNNGGPQHGLVTSELTFYLTTLKTLSVLPSKETEPETMNEIWSK